MMQVPTCNKTMLETIVKMFDILADISLILHENMRILQSEEIMSSEKDIPLISLVKATATIACTCCVVKKKVLSKGNTVEYSEFKCIQNEFDFSNNRKKWITLCRDCRCELVHHKEILYLQQLNCEPISKDKERQIEITKIISLLENEMETLLQFLAECNIFRKLHSKVYNYDNYKDFLQIQANKKRNKKEEYADIKNKYHKKLSNLCKQKLTSNDIESKLKMLYDLKYTGQMLRTIFKELLPKNDVFKMQPTKFANTTESPTMKDRKLYECFRNKNDNSEEYNLEPEEESKQDNLEGTRETDKCQLRECKELQLKFDEQKKEFLQNNSTTDMQSSYGSEENNKYSLCVKAGVRNDGAIIKKQPERKCKNSGSTKNSSDVIQANKVDKKVENPNNIVQSSLTDNTRSKHQNTANMDCNKDRTSSTNVKENPQRKCKNSVSTTNSSVIQANKVPETVENPNLVQTSLLDNIRGKIRNPADMDCNKDKTTPTISRENISLDYKSNEPRATINLKVDKTGTNTIIQEENRESSISDMKKQIDVTTEDDLRYANSQKEERGGNQQRPELSYIMDIVHRQFITIHQLSTKIDSLETSLQNNITSQIELNNKLDNASYIQAEVKELRNQIEPLERRIEHLEYILQHFTTYHP